MALALAELAAAPIPDYVEPVEGWRVWRVGIEDERIVLKSLFAGDVWEPLVPTIAACAAGHRPRWTPWRKKLKEHAAPELDCDCGIYGVRSVPAARSYLEKPALLSRDDRVIGRVALWGDVIEGPLGWRASHAYPIELLLPAPRVAQRALRQRARLDEIMFALEAYRVPVDVVAPSALAAYAVGP